MIYFKNRVDAGLKLANCFDKDEYRDATVLALPRGGVPVAYQVAQQLALPWAILPVRKLGVPSHPELAFGAIASEDEVYLNHAIIENYHLTQGQMDVVIAKEFEELNRRRQRYGRVPPNLIASSVMLVDDGIATGATVSAAIELLKQSGVKFIALAVPVIADETHAMLKPKVNEIITSLIAHDMYAIGQYYQDFSQVSDEEVLTYSEQQF